MRKCLLCGTESDGATCPNDGEASWGEVAVKVRGLRQDVVMQDEVDDVDLVEAAETLADSPEPNRVQTSRRKRRN